MSEVTMPEKQNKRQIAFARERLVVGEVILALLMAIFEHHSRSLKDNFGSSLETMAMIPAKSVELRLKELADNGVLIKDGGSYVANPEIFAESLEDARHVSIILGAAKRLEA
jgi:hypothetical protein